MDSLKGALFGCQDKYWPERDFNPPSVMMKLFIIGIYKWIVYLGVLGYTIASIVYLIIYRDMRTSDCRPAFNLWLYLCLAMVIAVTTTVITGYINEIKAAKSWLLTVRHISITLISLAFASYGSGVVAESTNEKLLHSTNCHKEDENGKKIVKPGILPSHFDDLATCTMFLAWAVFIYMIFRGFMIGIYGFNFLRRKPKYVKLDRDPDYPQHDPSLIIGKHRKNNKFDSDDSKEYSNDSNNNNNNNDIELGDNNEFVEKKRSRKEYTNSIRGLNDVEFNDVEDVDSQHLTMYSKVVKGNPNIVYDNIYREYIEDDNKQIFTNNSSKDNKLTNNKSKSNNKSRKRNTQSVLNDE